MAGVWGCPPEPNLHVLVLKAGVQRAPPFGRGLGVYPRAKIACTGAAGESRGGAPPGRLYGGVPRAQAGVQRVPPPGRGLGVSPRGSPTIAGGVQRAPPFGRWYGGCASINYFSLLSPLPSRKGARGMVRATFETRPPEAEVQRATTAPDCFAALAMTVLGTARKPSHYRDGFLKCLVERG